jgi:uncharacterized membrane protein
MPRTYKELASKQDVIILSDANRDLFSGQVLRWFSDGVLEEGMGLLMTGGRESFGAYFSMPDWTPTSVGNILPVESTRQEDGPDGRVRVLVPENVFMASLPWGSIGRYGFFFGCNPVGEKDGAEVLAELVPDVGETNPLLVWWDIGDGRTFAMTSDWTPAGANLFLEWEFYSDYAINLVLFIASQEIPSDPVLVHRIRMELEEYHLKRSFLLSVIEFVVRFGANPEKVEEMMGAADRGLREVGRLYMDYEFQTSLARAETLVQDLEEATDMALELKDQALFWIYVAEWAAMMGTGLVAGVVLWSLMVKRRLYSQVATTRSRTA